MEQRVRIVLCFVVFACERPGWKRNNICAQGSCYSLILLLSTSQACSYCFVFPSGPQGNLQTLGHLVYSHPQRSEHVFANELKTARLVKLIFHTVLLGSKNTHKHTRWNMEDGGRGGSGGLGGGLVMFMLCAFVLGSGWVGG